MMNESFLVLFSQKRTACARAWQGGRAQKKVERFFLQKEAKTLIHSCG
jgi:hypothetical protein